MRRLLSSLHRLRCFFLADRGVAAVEFALILPLALILYAGAAQVSDGVMTSRKITSVSRTLVDLLSLQATSAQITSYPTPSNAVPSSTLSNLLTSAATLLAPQPITSLVMTISAIDVVNGSSGTCCKATVRWSFTQDGSLRPCNTELTPSSSATPAPDEFPAELLPQGIPLPSPLSFLVADVGYTYQPTIRTSILNFVPAMQRTFYTMPRSIGQVVAGPLPSSGHNNGQVCY